MPNGTPNDKAPLASKRACFHCAKSKLRCIWPESDDGQIVQPTPISRSSSTSHVAGAITTSACKRCSRQGHNCWVAEASRRGPRVGNGGARSRVGKLEKKLDSIMTMLARSENVQPSSPPTNAPSTSSDTWTAVLASLNRGSTDNGGSESGSPSAAATTQSLTIAPGYNITVTEADAILDKYRTRYFPRFPFVQIPTSSSAIEVSLNQPFLFKTIVHIILISPSPLSGAGDGSSKESKPWSRPKFHRWFRRTLLENILGEAKKSLELVQAILVFGSWGDYYLSGEPRGSEIIQMAVSVVTDLGLDVPAIGGPEHTLAERRAVLGCFYLTSVISTILRQPATPSWTPYLSKCCDHLLKSHASQCPESDPSDIYLVALVRMHLQSSHWSSVLNPSPGVGIQLGGTTVQVAPAVSRTFNEGSYLAISLAQSEVEAIANSLPDHIRDDPLLWSVNQHATRIRLNSMAINIPVPRTNPSYSSCHNPERSDSATTNLTTTCSSLPIGPRPVHEIDPLTRSRRLQTLCACLQSCVDLINACLTIPPSEVIYCPLTTSFSLALALVTLRRLLVPSAFAVLPDGGDGPGVGGMGSAISGEIDDWDAKLARESVDVEGLLDRLCALFEGGMGAAFGTSGFNRQANTDLVVSGHEVGGAASGMNGNGSGGPGHYGGIGIVGYWRKLKMLKAWYMAEVAVLDLNINANSSASAAALGQDMEFEGGADEMTFVDADFALFDMAGDGQADGWIHA